MLAGKRGTSLTGELWGKLMKVVPALDAAVEELDDYTDDEL